jgi:NCS1 family nucleobase:cation symporter-1
MQPWKLLGSYGNYVVGWLDGYSGFLGPIAGILICDYFVRRKKIIKTEDLYKRNGLYEFSHGVSWKAIAALAIGSGVAFVGLVFSRVRVLYDYAWFVGFGASFVAYLLLTTNREPAE